MLSYRDLSSLDPDLDYSQIEAGERRKANHYRWHVAKFVTENRLKELDEEAKRLSTRTSIDFWRYKLEFFIREF